MSTTSSGERINYHTPTALTARQRSDSAPSASSSTCAGFCDTSGIDLEDDGRDWALVGMDGGESRGTHGPSSSAPVASPHPPCLGCDGAGPGEFSSYTHGYHIYAQSNDHRHGSSASHRDLLLLCVCLLGAASCLSDAHPLVIDATEIPACLFHNFGLLSNSPQNNPKLIYITLRRWLEKWGAQVADHDNQGAAQNKRRRLRSWNDKTANVP